MNFLKWLMNIVFGWIVNPINSYMKVLKEQYLWLIVAPMVIVGGMFYYFHTKGIAIWAENELITVIPFFGIPIFIFLQAFVVVGYLFDKKFPEAFGESIRLLIVVFITAGYWHYYMPDFTQKVENFQKEKHYYLRQIDIQESDGRDGKGQLLGFDSVGSDGNYSCQIYYDESDTLLDPVNDHRELGAFQTLHVNNNREKIGQIPIKVTKLEPYFYYVCRDYSQFQPNYKKTSKEQK